VRQDRRLRRNSVPLYAHGLAEYGVGGLSILAPFLFSSATPPPRSRSCRAAIIVLGFVTESPTGVVRNMPIASTWCSTT